MPKIKKLDRTSLKDSAGVEFIPEVHFSEKVGSFYIPLPEWLATAVKASPLLEDVQYGYTQLFKLEKNQLRNDILTFKAFNKEMDKALVNFFHQLERIVTEAGESIQYLVITYDEDKHKCFAQDKNADSAMFQFNYTHLWYQSKRFFQQSKRVDKNGHNVLEIHHQHAPPGFDTTKDCFVYEEKQSWRGETNPTGKIVVFIKYTEEREAFLKGVIASIHQLGLRVGKFFKDCNARLELIDSKGEMLSNALLRLPKPKG
jgi:hypothetical protein